MMQHGAGRARLGHASGIEHRHRIAEAVDDAEIVADQQHREIAAHAQFVEQRQDLRLDGDVECGRGFVEQQQVGLAREGSGNAHPLLHAARELMGVAPHYVSRPRHAQLGEQIGATLPGEARLDAEMEPHRLGELAADGQGRIERGGRVLENDADAATAQHRRFTQKIVAIEAQALRADPRGRTEQTQQRQHDGRLARSRFAHQAQHAAGRDGERHVVERLQPAATRGVGDRQDLDVERGGGERERVRHDRGPVNAGRVARAGLRRPD